MAQNNRSVQVVMPETQFQRNFRRRKPVVRRGSILGCGRIRGISPPFLWLGRPFMGRVFHMIKKVAGSDFVHVFTDECSL